MDSFALKKRSVRVSGHDTSVTLEEPFWSALKDIAHERRASVAKLISEIDEKRQGNLSSSIRIYILRHYQEKLAQ